MTRMEELAEDGVIFLDLYSVIVVGAWWAYCASHRLDDSGHHTMVGGTTSL
jgi:hypothetical protein